MRDVAARSATGLTVGVLARLLTAWFVSTADPAPALADLVVLVLDYLLAGMMVFTVIAVGWRIGTTAYTAVAGWMDHRLAAGLRRWRDAPRSRWSDAITSTPWRRL
ncbi:hypothetical protein ABZS66_00125 [Dactylosporangium sp. NPDC005572]|uniref:hypothetical protein n=1 Tax=Dactylosporangium sp. NPDC005572 TaxID=3156889 RepID=UPI0033AABD6B